MARPSWPLPADAERPQGKDPSQTPIAGNARATSAAGRPTTLLVQGCITPFVHAHVIPQWTQAAAPVSPPTLTTLRAPASSLVAQVACSAIRLTTSPLLGLPSEPSCSGPTPPEDGHAQTGCRASYSFLAASTNRSLVALSTLHSRTSLSEESECPSRYSCTAPRMTCAPSGLGKP